MNTRTPIGSKIGMAPGTQPSRPGDKTGMTKLGNPAIATPPEPSQQTGAGANRTQIYTYIAQPGATKLLYNGDRLWARVTLTLETAGPVVIGDQQQLLPIARGIGDSLRANVPYEVVIARGTKLYIATTAFNRVGVKIEPLPWLEQITAIAGIAANKLAELVDLFRKRG
jgi:hypothetical protein